MASQLELLKEPESSLEVYCGQNNQELEHHFFTALRADLKQGKPFTPQEIVCPSHTISANLRLSLAHAWGDFGGLYLYSFHDFLRQLLIQRAPQKLRPFLSPSIAHLNLSQLLEDQKLFTHFTSSTLSEGFIAELMVNFEELLTHKCAHLRSVGTLHPDFFESFHLFQSRMLEDYQTAAQLFCQARIAILEKSDKAETKHTKRRLWFYGFGRLNSVQIEFIHALSKVRPVCLYLHDDLSEPKRGEAFRKKAPACRVVTLGSSPKLKPKPKLYRFFDAYAEWDCLARLIHHKIEHEGFLPNQIGVVYPASPEDQEILVQKLSDHGLSVSIFEGRPLSWEKNFAALGALRLYLNSARRARDVHDLLLCLPFAWPAEFKGEDACYWLDAALLSHSHQVFSKRLEDYAHRSPEKDHIICFQTWLRALLTDLEQLQQDHASWSVLAQSLQHFVDAYLEPTEARSQIQGWIQDLSLEPTGFLEPHIDHALRILEDRAGSSKQPLSENKGGISLVAWPHAYLLHKELIIIPRLTESHYPRPFTRLGFLRENIRANLNETYDADLATTQEHEAAENALFGRILQNAKQEVILSYPKYQNSEQREYMPSPLLRLHCPELLAEDIAPYPWQNASGSFGRLSPFDSHKLMLSPSSTDKKTQSEGTTPFHRICPAVRQLEAWQADRFSSPGWSPFEGLIKSEKSARAQYLSVSQLQTYAQCPRRYFYQYVLKLEAYEDMDQIYGLRPLERGILLHDILHRLYLDLRTQQLFPLSIKNWSQMETLLKKAVDGVCRKYQHRVPLRYLPMWALEQKSFLRDAARILMNDLDEASAFRPLHFEYAFGQTKPETDKRSFEIKLGTEVYQLKGKIDRIDQHINQKSFRVLDYKSGKLDRVSGNRFDAGKSIQLPIYMLAWQHHKADLQLKDMDGVLWSSRMDSKADQTYFEGAVLEHRHAELMEILNISVEGMERGAFFPRPGPSAQNCRDCPYTHLCGSSVTSRAHRRQQDPQSKKHERLEQFK